MKRILLGSLGALFLIAAPARASSILDFALPLNDYDGIQAHFPNYGDNLAGTPNITVDLLERSIADNSIATHDLEYWNTNYGDLLDVAFTPHNGGTYGEVVLTPAPGFGVRLLSFDVAGYSVANHTNQPVYVNGANINPSGVILGSGPSHSSFAPNTFSSSGIVIDFGFNDWNVGIDNIQFEQCTLNVDQRCVAAPPAVPEPATMGLLASGLVALVARRLTRKSKG